MQTFYRYLNIAIAFLRSPEATLLFLIAALAAQIPHSAAVFHRVSTSSVFALNLLHGYLFALAVEFAVLIFVVRKQIKYAWLFAGFSIAINIVYYYQAAWVADPVAASPAIAGALLSSVMLPLAIALYSHDVADGTVQPAKPAQAEVAKPVQAAKPAKPAKRKSAKQSATQRRLQIKEAGLQTVDQIVQMFGVSERTAYNDLAALPEVAEPVANGSEK